MPPRFTFGPPRYFRPVCVLRRLGFVGGPSGYRETESGEGGPLVLTQTKHEQEIDPGLMKPPTAESST